MTTQSSVSKIWNVYGVFMVYNKTRYCDWLISCRSAI